MRARIFLALFGFLGCAATAQAQPGPTPPVFPGDSKAVSGVPSPLKNGKDELAPTEAPVSAGHSGLSDWIVYRRQGCDSSGWDPALQTELYLRVGPSFPFGGDLFGDVLSTGWMIQGGGKVLFFNEPHTRAWFVDLSIANVYNHANDDAPLNPVIIGGVPTAIREFNRTFVGLGLGREWYLRGNGLDGAPTWRWGVDAGGRWGSASVDFTDIQHKTDVIGGTYLGVQTDVEWPSRCGPCMYVFGLRGEWAYTWSDILEQRSDVMDFNLLVHLGIRY